jgi:hypothetical protein
MSRETGGFERQDKIRKMQSGKVIASQTNELMIK